MYHIIESCSRGYVIKEFVLSLTSTTWFLSKISNPYQLNKQTQISRKEHIPVQCTSLRLSSQAFLRSQRKHSINQKIANYILWVGWQTQVIRCSQKYLLSTICLFTTTHHMEIKTHNLQPGPQYQTTSHCIWLTYAAEWRSPQLSQSHLISPCFSPKLVPTCPQQINFTRCSHSTV